MTLDEARAIVAAEDDSDPARALEAVAMILRFNAISEPKLLDIAQTIEQVAGDLGRSESPPPDQFHPGWIDK